MDRRCPVSRDRAATRRSVVAHALLAAVAVLLALPLASFAQGGVGVVPAGPRTDPEAARIRDEKQREMQLRNLEASASHSNEKAVRAALDQLNQDFKRIQIIRNDIAHAIKVDGALDYKRVSDQTSEVKKRALRMQSYLALRGPGAEAKDQAGPEVEYDDEQMKAALVRLCKRIDSFVANPKFTSPLVADVGGTADASRDLREIIALSAGIRSSAERLSRKDR
jgi:NAD(P)-dependent dehydrogenase (short-subunit alcohol dehydrogenase family)